MQEIQKWATSLMTPMYFAIKWLLNWQPVMTSRLINKSIKIPEFIEKGLLPHKVLIEIIILNPFCYLQDYFKSRTTGIPASQKFGTSTEDDSLPVLTSNG